MTHLHVDKGVLGPELGQHLDDVDCAHSLRLHRAEDHRAAHPAADSVDGIARRGRGRERGACFGE